MTAHSKRPKPGDFLRISVDGLAAHIYYLGKHSEYGDVIRVVGSASVPDNLSDQDALLATGYTAFYPVRAAAREGLAHVVRHHEHGGAKQVPTKLRRPGARARDGGVLTWVIEQDGREYVTKHLTAEERSLPIAVIWNHEMLCTRIRDGWRPEIEGA